MNDNFIDWLIEQRVNWLTRSQKYLDEEEMFSEIKDIFENAKENREIVDRIAIFVDKIEHERRELFYDGVKDGIRLSGAIKQM